MLGHEKKWVYHRCKYNFQNSFRRLDHWDYFALNPVKSKKLVLKVIQIFNTVIFFVLFFFNVETEFEIIRNGTIYKIYDEVSDYHLKKVILKIRFQSILVFMKNNQDRKTVQNKGVCFCVSLQRTP